MMKILVANDHEVYKDAGGYPKFVEYVALSKWPGARVNWQTRGIVYAFIGRSEWRVMCPLCGSGLFGEPGLPFYCPSCLMQANDGFAMDVVYPENRAAIEEVLLLRPVPNTRNWYLDNTVENLLADNLEAGVPIP